MGAVLLSSAAMAQSSLPPPPVPQSAIPAPAVAPPSRELPPLPPGKSTVIGGVIRNVDPVRDQLTLQVFGGSQTMKIFYDERTQVYRNGQRMRVRDLKPEDHASVETALDGTQVFALRIHMLTTLPQGEAQGQVLSYDPGSGELVVNASLSREPIRLHVPRDTQIVRVGQKAFSAGQRGAEDLYRGALVNVTFQADARGQGTVTHIDVLATPGSSFTFTGEIASLDVQAGLLVIVDPHDSQSYQFTFTPSLFPVTRQLHQGSSVQVVANFDGVRYVVSALTMQ